MAFVQKATVVSKEKKTKSAPARPPYLAMIQEAIVSLKERTGSSQYAIGKYIEEQHSSYNLPQNFKKLLLVQLKKLVAFGKLVKVKNSFKLAPALKFTAPAAEKNLKPKAVSAADAAKPKTKTAANAVKPKAAKVGAEKLKAAPKAKEVAKPTVKAVVKPKLTSTEKVAKTAVISSPGKKSAAKVKKLVAKKPKSINSPVKKAAVRKPKK